MSPTRCKIDELFHRRVSIYNSRTAEIRRELPSFKDLARSGVYRRDGRLVASGSDAGLVRVFNAKTRAPMRQFRDHAGPVHVTRFASSGGQLFTAGDDKTARLWDIASGTAISCVRGHTDYIRSGTQAATGEGLWLTGSYDHTVRLWDLRTAPHGSPSSSSASAASASGKGLFGAAVMAMNHGAPVNAVLALPGGSLVVTAGSNELKVWDLTAGAKLLQTVSAHQKSITCMCLTSSGDRLLTGGLDGHVKVYSVGDFTPVYGFKHGGAITSVALPADLTRLAVGTADGTLTVRQRTVQTSEAVMARAKSAVVRGGTYRFFLRGAGDAAGDDDVTLAPSVKPTLKAHDQLLKRFRYGAALDAALATGNSVITASMLTELTQRGGLRVALSGRDEESLEPLLALLVKHTPNPRFTQILTETCHAVLDLYAPVLGRSARVRSMLAALQSRVRGEMAVQRELLKLQGGLDMLLNSSGSAMAAAAEAADVEETDGADDATLAAALGPLLDAATSSEPVPAAPGADDDGDELSLAAVSAAGRGKRRVSFDAGADEAEADPMESKRTKGKVRGGKRRKA